MPGGGDIHHLDQVAAIDDGIELVAVYLNVVADVAEFVHHAGIAFRVNIDMVDARFVVVVVERGLVAAHIPLVEQEKTFDIAARIAAAHLDGGGGEDELSLAARGEGKNGEHERDGGTE